MKKILITGASGGIGNKVTQILLKEGYFVIGTYFNDKNEIDNLKTNENFIGRELDIGNLEMIKKLQKESNLDLYAIVNCSGIVDYENGNLENDIDVWNRTLQTNLTGNYYLAKVFGNNLAQNGRFIMISSTDAFFGSAITLSYAVSKAGVNSLTKSLALLFQDKKIRVNTVAPGWVNTRMIEDIGEEFLKKVADMNPLKRNADSEDIGNVIKFLLSKDSDYINGQVIPVEGGYTVQDPTLLLEEETKK